MKSVNYPKVCWCWCGWLGSNVDEAARVLMCADTNIDPILIKYYYGQTRDIHTPDYVELRRGMARRRIQTSDTDRVTTMGYTAHRECSGVRRWILRFLKQVLTSK